MCKKVLFPYQPEALKALSAQKRSIVDCNPYIQAYLEMGEQPWWSTGDVSKFWTNRIVELEINDGLGDKLPLEVGTQRL